MLDRINSLVEKKLHCIAEPCHPTLPYTQPLYAVHELPKLSSERIGPCGVQVASGAGDNLHMNMMPNPARMGDVLSARHLDLEGPQHLYSNRVAGEGAGLLHYFRLGATFTFDANTNQIKPFHWLLQGLTTHRMNIFHYIAISHFDRLMDCICIDCAMRCPCLLYSATLIKPRTFHSYFPSYV